METEFNGPKLAALAFIAMVYGDPFDLCYALDFQRYRETGQSLTGATYMNTYQGPRMIESVDAYTAMYTAVCWAGGHEHDGPTMVIPEIFNDDEIEFIERALLDDKVSLSDFTGHKLAAMGEEIPYNSAYLSADPLSEADLEWLRRAFEGHGDPKPF